MSVKFIKNIVRIKKKNENEFKQIGAFGFKDEDAEAIRSDLEELESEVDGKASTESVQNLNSSKLSKPTSGIAVGKYFKVASIDSEGNPVLEACELPVASIVKSGMTSTTDPEWADAEKLSARQRMGLGGNWELIEDITVGEDTDVINRTAEPNGTLYDFIGLLIVFCATTVTGGVIYSYVNNNVNTQSYLTVTNNTMQYTRAVHKIDNGVITTTYHEMGVSTVGQASTIKERNYPLLFADKINAVKIGASGKIATGSNIKIYGIRA